ncbi:A-kinase anchor protein 17A-like isoform X2 [Varroa jacobsoni]|uniref:A-kinase anchor protein 17A n=1 Tax=Varroa destructor TaxID=109461 RepID=A0A7M7MAX8_VARDE|nr:A-kinase anchor protein 17B-like isoform X2 [Varroa destructor]XP_022699412.1 A-kinase anchor protein 17A-like isoform X2 [Varroa jacobsoni]
MASIHSCTDISDAVELEPSVGLYLKPICRANITLLLPASLAKHCISVSNWELQEKLREVARPITLVSLRVSKTTMDIVRFEAELSNRQDLKLLIERMDTAIKLQGWPESARVRCGEAKLVFPSRHDWEAFFRDAKGLDEMRPGERPDTLHIKGLPIKWFAERETSSGSSDIHPSLTVLHRVFRAIADVRCVDIPILDHRDREKLKSGEDSFGKIGSCDLVFDAYVQYREYVGFVKAMDALRGMKLLYRPPLRGDRSDTASSALTANIIVDFDKTGHLSDAKIRARSMQNAKTKKNLLNVIRKEQLKRKMREEKEALKKNKLESDERQLREEARRLCKRLIQLVAKDYESSAASVRAPSAKELLLMQEQQLRERLLRKMHEKKGKMASVVRPIES